MPAGPTATSWRVTVASGSRRLNTLTGVHARPSPDVQDMNAMHPSPREQSDAPPRSVIATSPGARSKTPRRWRPGQKVVEVLASTGSHRAPVVDVHMGVAP